MLHVRRRELRRGDHTGQFAESEQGFGDFFHCDRPLFGVCREHAAEERIKGFGRVSGHRLGINRADLVEDLQQAVGGECWPDLS